MMLLMCFGVIIGVCQHLNSVKNLSLIAPRHGQLSMVKLGKNLEGQMEGQYFFLPQAIVKRNGVTMFRLKGIIYTRNQQNLTNTGALVVIVNS